MKTPTTYSLSPETIEIVKELAIIESRSASQMVEILIQEALRARGILPQPQ
jgi:hypothetical protein